jgi:hypothetical protein
MRLQSRQPDGGPVHCTVGAQSITRFLKKIVFLPQHISGHRHDRELWFFCLIDLNHGYHVDLKKCKKIQPFFLYKGLKSPPKKDNFFTYTRPNIFFKKCFFRENKTEENHPLKVPE